MYVCMYVCMIIKYNNSGVGIIVNPARGQLNRENECFPVSVRA